MSCTRCGAPMAAADTACPGCGAAPGTPPAQGAAGERVWTTAGNLLNAARAAEGRLRDPAIDAALPGGLATIGYAGLLFAVLLDMSPVKHSDRYVSFGWDLSKLGHFWDVVLLAAAAAALSARLLPLAGRAVPRPLTHPALPAGVAALAAAQAYLLLDASLIPGMLLAAAAILVYDAVRTGLARAAAARFERTVQGLPNPTAAGAATVGVAILLSGLPGTHSFLGGVVVLGNEPTGTTWGLLMLAASAAAVAVAVGLVPLGERHTAWALGGYTLLATAWAVVLFNLSLVPLLWLAGASVAAYDRFAAARERTGGALSLHRLTVGPRLLVLAGVPVSILAMSLTWRTVSSGGYFMGGYEPSYSSYYGGYVGGYNFTKYYVPGFSASNTGFALGPSRFSFSPLVVAALLALVVAALWVSDEPVPKWGYVVPAGIVAVVGLWGVAHLNLSHLGPWVFLAGLALIGVAAVSVALPTVREYAAGRAAPQPPAPTAPSTPA